MPSFEASTAPPLSAIFPPPTPRGKRRDGSQTARIAEPPERAQTSGVQLPVVDAPRAPLTARPAGKQPRPASRSRPVDTPLEPLRLLKPPWWYPAEGVLNAADDFDHGFQELRSLARQRLWHLKKDSTSYNGTVRFENTLSSLRRMRYNIQPLRLTTDFYSAGTSNFMARHHTTDFELARDRSGPWASLQSELETDAGQKEAAFSARRPRRRQWRLEKSIWGPRKVSSNSQDFFETGEAMRATFEVDWEYARSSHGLERFIKKVQAEVLRDRKQAFNPEGLDLALDDSLTTPGDLGDKLNAEVAEAREVIWKHHLIIYGGTKCATKPVSHTLLNARLRFLSLVLMAACSF